MNNVPRFDPMTGQPLSQDNNTLLQENPIPSEQNINIDPNNQTKELMQSVPTIEQNKQEFIQNVQDNSAASEKKDKDSNMGFIIFLFIVILAAIIFLFPYLIKIL